MAGAHAHLVGHVRGTATVTPAIEGVPPPAPSAQGVELLRRVDVDGVGEVAALESRTRAPAAGRGTRRRRAARRRGRAARVSSTGWPGVAAVGRAHRVGAPRRSAARRDHRRGDERLVAERHDGGVDVAQRRTPRAQRGGLARPPSPRRRPARRPQVDAGADLVGRARRARPRRGVQRRRAPHAASACSSSGRPSTRRAAWRRRSARPSPAARTSPPTLTRLRGCGRWRAPAGRRRGRGAWRRSRP